MSRQNFQESSGRAVTFNQNYSDRGRGSYRGRGNYNVTYNNSDFGADAFNQNDMRKYGNKKSFKRPRCAQNYYKPPRGGGPRAHLDGDDDDDDMIGSEPGPSQVRRFNPYGGGRGRSRGGRSRGRGMDNGMSQRLGGYSQHDNRQMGSRGRGRYSYDNRTKQRFTGGPTAWFRVTLPYGRKYDRESQISKLLNTTSVPFVPKDFQLDDNNLVFLIQDSAAANALLECSGRITHPDGFKMNVRVSPTKQPSTQNLTDEVVEKLKVCMSSRYDPATKAMNLSALDKDPALLGDDIRLPLVKLSVARAVLKIINENIPELESLDVQNNGLSILSVLASLPAKAPNLVRLDLGNNQVKNLSELDCLTQIPLVELGLDRNPLCNNYSNETVYVSAVRKKFPKVIKLDGNDLPPPITFDIETSTKVPDSKGSYLGSNEQAKTLVCQFVQQYMGLYDSSNRQALLDAYYDQAVFSMTYYRNQVMPGDQPPFGNYMNRNLYRALDTTTRVKTLKTGRLSIVAYLSELPATEHDLSSLILDIIHLSASMLVFSVQGVFKEGNADTPERSRHMRSFTRIFVTLPVGAGLSILNEELTITNASPATRKKAFKLPDPPTSPQGAAVAPPTLTSEQQLQLTQQFAKQSGMNMAWSSKCLIENNWNYELSAKMFTELQANGNIPPEAFTPDVLH